MSQQLQASFAQQLRLLQVRVRVRVRGKVRFTVRVRVRVFRAAIFRRRSSCACCRLG